MKTPIWRDKAIKTPKHTCWYQKGKICYDKKGATSAKNLRYKKDKVELRTYWCPHCNFWHLTKQINNRFMSEETPQEEQLAEIPSVTITDLPQEEKPAQDGE